MDYPEARATLPRHGSRGRCCEYVQLSAATLRLRTSSWHGRSTATALICLDSKIQQHVHSQRGRVSVPPLQLIGSMLSSNDNVLGLRPHTRPKTPLIAHLTQISRPRSCTRLRSYAAEQDPVVTTAWLAEHLNEVTILDVRGHVDTVLVSEGLEESTYIAEYDEYLEGHIPVSSHQTVVQVHAFLLRLRNGKYPSAS